MADHSHSVQHTGPDNLANIPDEENEAIIDAAKTFKWTGILFILFAACAAFIIYRTRAG